MKLKTAVDILKSENLSCVIYKDSNNIIKSSESGIKPLMVQLRNNKDAFSGCVIADKVVGKAAALMAVLGKAQAVYGITMSKSAKEVLENNNIEYSCDTLVDYIENRTKTDMCPLEKSVLRINDCNQAFEALEETIKQLMKK